mmetsp:Transcript_13271/g.24889  ORF Transcript_13271/g.24889 Transcript_13271/m.24889 type:complete len:198 (-) Transcript_13271:1592-2185(-)|eukprot:CAMPEP_0204900928 /NCGR_PEP_ID=MMETSP1397-20131031/2767_1 /ASSEMBLY_ACC=CAM_ASM_000891 /TAXON_ID=49980 /ORGANISM="Climacostomum Climacostomum virens, Strain Stock W-24" /LENGTH=197 /DNA_ID=CAMNT_0052069169 /DNA_START=60 /DNA_END=653 /DNA_ORIENTATION=+
MEPKQERTVKLMLLGDSSVGKTCILCMLMRGQIPQSYMPTIGIDTRSRTFDIGGQKIKLQVWDTAGQEKLRMIPKSYFSRSEGFIIVYDITNAETFMNISYWIEQTRLYKDNTMKLLIGNKSDLEAERQVPTEKGQELAERIGVEFVETSAMTGSNIEEAFNMIAKRLLDEPEPHHEPSVKISEASCKSTKTSGCCK